MLSMTRTWLRREPKLLAVEDRRFYHAYLWVYLTMLGLYAYWVPVFGLLEEPRLVFTSGLMTLVGVLGITLHRQHHMMPALVLMMSSLTLLTWLATYCFGSAAGYEYYFFIVLAGIHLAPLGVRVRTGATLVLFLAAVSSLALSDPHVSNGFLSLWMVQSANLFMAFMLILMFLWRLLVLTDHLERQYREDACSDELTGLVNRRQILRYAAQCWQENIPFSVLMLDADHFKRVNDQHGHAAGDEVLRHMGSLMTATFRQGDYAGRIGGEEFLVLLPRSGRTEAVSVAGRLRSLLSHSSPMFAGQAIPVTVSIGVSVSYESDSLEAMLVLADRRLYHAKRTGRDKVVAGGERDEGSKVEVSLASSRAPDRHADAQRRSFAKDMQG